MDVLSKIITFEKLVNRLDKVRQAGGKVVFTNGCFDILHVGHVRYLTAARSEGDLLVVGLNSDESVRRIKGINGRLWAKTTGAKYWPILCAWIMWFFLKSRIP